MFPFQGSYRPGPTDQGWDIDSLAGAPVYAITGGMIGRVQQDPGGFGANYPTLFTTAPIGGPSQEVYYGHIHSSQGIGTSVTQGQMVWLTHMAAGDGNGGPGHLEIGFGRGGSPIGGAAGAIMKALLTGVAPPSGAGAPGTGAMPTFTAPGAPNFGPGAPAAMATAVATKLASALTSKVQSLTAAMPTSGAPVGSVPGNVRQWIEQAMAIVGVGPDWENDLLKVAMRESGGDPHAINLWDSNAKAGHPSKGLMQTIDSTFQSNMLPGHGDIWNPVDNAIAAIRYIQGRYGGNHAQVAGPSGYDSGGLLMPGLTLAVNKTGAPERIYPPNQVPGGGAVTIHTTLHITGNGTAELKANLAAAQDAHDKELARRVRLK